MQQATRKEIQERLDLFGAELNWVKKELERLCSRREQLENRRAELVSELQKLYEQP